MSNYPTVAISGVIAASGDYLLPRQTADQAGKGHLSYEKGWNIETQLPLDEGGVPPYRTDFNGLAYLFSQYLLWYQQGGVMRYSATLDYEEGNEVFYSGSKYRCIKATGPSSTVVTPGTNKVYWKNLDAPSVIAGQITPFYNCKLGGSDGRRLVPWGEDTADERYVLCDGGSDGLGGAVPNLIDKFILPSTVAKANTEGGNLSATTGSTPISGTVGETTLTASQIPSHGHTITISSAGSHSHTATTDEAGGHGHTASSSSAGSHSHSASSGTAGSHAHTRGSMEITGHFSHWDATITPVDGAFWDDASVSRSKNGKSGQGEHAGSVAFNASRSWTGSTSTEGSHSHGVSVSSAGSHSHTITVSRGGSHVHGVDVNTAGSHTHTVTIGNTGGGGSHTHTLAGASHTHSVTLDRPPFYRLAYFVKLPE